MEIGILAVTSATGLYYFFTKYMQEEWVTTWGVRYNAFKSARANVGLWKTLAKEKDAMDVGLELGQRCLRNYFNIRMDSCADLEQMDKLRQAARGLLELLGSRYRKASYLTNQGWAEAQNVFHTCAALEAVHFAIHDKKDYNVQIKDFADVVQLLCQVRPHSCFLGALEAVYTDERAYCSHLRLKLLRQLEMSMHVEILVFLDNLKK